MDELKEILDIDVSISLTPEQWSAVLEQVEYTNMYKYKFKQIQIQIEANTNAN